MSNVISLLFAGFAFLARVVVPAALSSPNFARSLLNSAFMAASVTLSYGGFRAKNSSSELLFASVNGELAVILLSSILFIVVSTELNAIYLRRRGQLGNGQTE